MIVKYTATYSDGSTADFLSLEDLIAHDEAPELHPDVGQTQNAPAEEPAPVDPAPVDPPADEPPADAPPADLPPADPAPVDPAPVDPPQA